MIPAAFAYAVPGSVAEALAMLQQNPDAKVIAGGQSLIPMMRFRMAQPGMLVDIGRIPGLDRLAEEGGFLRIGALVRHATMEHSALIRGRYPLLAATARVVADPIVRNLGTVVGSLVHADPAGDWAAAMMAARARVVIAGPGGERTVDIDSFFVDTFTTAVGPDEMATEVQVPLAGPGAGGDYQKIERKVGDFATAAVGAQLALNASGRCQAAGIGLCAVGPVTLRAADAEASLVGAVLDETAIARAGQLAGAAADPGADSRGSADYKRDMVRVLTIRALRRAADRARQGLQAGEEELT